MIFVDFVVLKGSLIKAKVERVNEDKEKYLVSYYDKENKYHCEVLTREDILSEEEYEQLKTRINKINKVMRG